MRGDFFRTQRPYPVNSNASRKIWSNSSQPSSPMKREDQFRYDMQHLTNDKFLKMVADRKEEELNSGNSYEDIEIQNPLCDTSDSSKEDEEVTEINKKTIKKDLSRPNIEKDVRSRSNLIKMRSLRDEDNFAFEICDFDKKLKKVSTSAHTNEREKKTLSEQDIENCTVETQTDITMPIASGSLLDQYVETSLKRHLTQEPSTRADMELQMLYLQLQYERYRREVYAERNRRLLGRSRDNATLKMDIEKLMTQLESLSREHCSLVKNLNETKMAQNSTEQELSKECNTLRAEVQIQRDTNKKLQTNIESLDRRLAEETEEKNRYERMLESAKADIFELKSLLQQCQYQADVGTKYKEELQRLQSREVLMGEMKLKCSEKLIELENLRARENEINHIKNACMEEVKELKTELGMKTSQFDAAKERIQNIESQLQRQNSLVADQKRCVKMVKEEYEEKLKAVEAKYAVQKAIILRMEEAILDPSKHRSNVNSEPDKSGMLFLFHSMKC